MKYFALILLFIFSFNLYAVPFLPSVGGKPDSKDRKNYASRAENYYDKEFHNLDETSVMNKKDAEDEFKISMKGTKPVDEIPVKESNFITELMEEDFTLTWFGHSSFLIQMNGKNILFDPVFTDMISPVSFTGVQKFVSSPVKISELPFIDILIISHDHYDHLDYKAILELDSKVGQYVVPLGVETHLRKWKIDREKVCNMAWWEEIEIDGIKISCVPARHFSGRWITGRNRTLWASWVLNDGRRQIFENADSGYGSHYELIHEKFGDFDFALMECGQYNVKWPNIHSFPEEGVKAMKELGAKLVMPVHWGAAVLSDHGWDDSPERFVRESEKEGLEVITPFIGQTVDFNNLESLESAKNNYWWRDIN